MACIMFDCNVLMFIFICLYAINIVINVYAD